MIQIRIKVLPAMGAAHGKWEVVEFDEFLLRHSPQLRMHISIAHQFPPFHIINEELLSGGQDQGVSGGCFWKPFEIEESDYIEIKDEMITNPKLKIDYDTELEQLPTIKKWCGAVGTKHNPRRRSNAI